MVHAPPVHDTPPAGIPGEEALVGKAFTTAPPATARPIGARATVALVGGKLCAADALTCPVLQKRSISSTAGTAAGATKVYHEPLMNAPNVEFCWNSTVSRAAARQHFP